VISFSGLHGTHSWHCPEPQAVKRSLEGLGSACFLSCHWVGLGKNAGNHMCFEDVHFLSFSKEPILPRFSVWIIPSNQKKRIVGQDAMNGETSIAHTAERERRVHSIAFRHKMQGCARFAVPLIKGDVAETKTVAASERRIWTFAAKIERGKLGKYRKWWQKIPIPVHIKWVPFFVVSSPNYFLPWFLIGSDSPTLGDLSPTERMASASSRERERERPLERVKLGYPLGMANI